MSVSHSQAWLLLSGCLWSHTQAFALSLCKHAACWSKHCREGLCMSAAWQVLSSSMCLSSRQDLVYSTSSHNCVPAGDAAQCAQADSG